MSKNQFFIFIVILVFFRYFTERIDIIVGSPFSQVTTIIFIIVALSLSFARNSQRYHVLEFSLLVVMFLIVFQGLVSALLNESAFLNQNLKQLMKYSSYLGGFIVFRFVLKTEFQLRVYAKSLGIALLLVCSVAIGQKLMGIGYADRGAPRPYGMSSHPALFAMLVFVSLITFALISKETAGRLLPKNIEKLLIVLATLALLFTEARTTWAGLTIVLFAYLIAKKRFREIILISAFSVFLSPFILERLADLSGIIEFIQNEDYLNNNHHEVMTSSFHWRIIHWHILFESALEKLYFGWGPGVTSNIGAYDKGAHSSVIEMLVEQGILGLLLFFIFIFCIAIYVKRFTKYLSKVSKYIIYAELFGVLLASILGQGIFNETHVMQTIMMQFVVIKWLNDNKKNQYFRSTANKYSCSESQLE